MNGRYVGTISRISLCFFSHLLFARITAAIEAAHMRAQQRQRQADFYTHLCVFYYRQDERCQIAYPNAKEIQFWMILNFWGGVSQFLTPYPLIFSLCVP